MQSTQLNEFKIKKMYQADYDTITPDETALYITPDGVIDTSDVINALGYTPYNGTINPNGYTSNIGTVTSVNNSQPDSTGNVSITIPEQIVYIVNYGEEIFLTIFYYITSGKTVLCKYNNEYMLPLSHFGNDIVFSQIVENEVIQCTITSTDQWSVTTTSLANTDLSNLSVTGEAKFQAPLGYTPENVNNKTLSITSNSTDLQYPSAKSVYSVVDGNWISSGLQIVNNVSVNYATNYSLNLSSYLPTDDLYEVAITGRATSGSTSGNFAPLMLSISSYPANVLVCEARTRTASTNQNTGSCIIIVKRTDTIQVVRDTGYNGSVNLWLLKYRRVR